MNEQSTKPEPDAAPAVATSTEPPLLPQTESAASNESESALRPLWIAIVVLVGLLGAETWFSQRRILGLQEDMARALKQGETINSATSITTKNVQEKQTVLEGKVIALETRQTETQSQQLALDQLYQDLSKNRDEWALAEIEQVLSTASQQLQLAGNVQGALIALQNADRSLSRSDRPQFITIRRAIAKDSEKLKALPAVDLIGVAVRIDNVIAQIDSLPMLADDRLQPVATPVKAVALAPKAKPGAKNLTPPEPTWGAKAQDMWRQWYGEMWTDVRDLVRVRTVNSPDALLLSPTQSYFVRENLKLRLLNARLGLLSRNEEAFRNDLIAAQEVLLKYFDVRAKGTQTVQASLRQVQGNNLAIELPTLSDSLNAVRNYKVKP